MGNIAIPLAAEAASGNLVTALGLDLRSLFLNTLAFFVILAILTRFVYPVLTRALDRKQEELNAAATAEADARAKLASADSDAREIARRAREDAERLLLGAQTEASDIVTSATDKARLQAQRITDDAKVELERDVAEARTLLRAESAQLVIKATRSILGDTMDQVVDQAAIKRGLDAQK